MELNNLKGDDFINRYRVEGTLTTASPFHLGNGFETERKGLETEKDGKKMLVKISAIATDHEGKPIIPGSSLKGAMRSYLLSAFSATRCGKIALANDRDYEDLMRKHDELQTQNAQIRFMREKATVLERLFGTPFAEGKIEVWDGECIASDISVDPNIRNPECPPFWDNQRLTYVDQSVAIDPDTGTAIDKKLYHYEVIPPGISFKLNITGQNLVYVELGMILFGLEAFNSEIWPLHLGAMSNRGFGRFEFTLDKVYHLPRIQMDEWIRNAVKLDHAGYFSLKELPESELKKHVDHFKTAFLKSLGDVP